MDTNFEQNARFTAIILLIAAVTQAVYTAFYVAEMTPPRQLLWGGEAFLFVLMAGFAGAALAQAKELHLVWSAILAAAILNVVQVGVGLTMFAPFFDVAGEVEATGPLAQGVLAFSFMVYNAAKVLLALALIVVGRAKMNAGAKALGGLSVAIGAIAFIANTLSMALGRDFSGELPIAGGSGVLATVLLAACLLTVSNED